MTTTAGLTTAGPTTAAQSVSGHRHGALPEIPNPGRVVEVRGATWAVADVRRQGLLRSPADEGSPGTQHLVSLQSLDEDRLGEELTVIWELEVGHTTVPDQGLPESLTKDTFDDPNTLGAFVDAVRWGAVTSADENAFQAPFRSGANVEPYQLEPLRRALGAPRTNLLLADDVGLGKTIEAGLVIQELLLRHRARTVVIVCPPSLSIKWQDEMRDKFGLEFVIVNSELLAQIRRSHGLAANPFRVFPRVIISMSWLPTPRAQRMLRDVLDASSSRRSARRYAFDLLVVDEAHHVAPASPSVLGGGRGYAVDSQRTMATRALAERCEHRLFLSATPHNGHSEAFTALLEMIDNRRFSRGAAIDGRALKDITVRRLKRDITAKDFKARAIKALPFDPSLDTEEAFATLDDLLRRSAEANGRKRSGDILALLLKKRFLSSPWAFASTLDRYADATTRSAAITYDDYYTEVLGSGQSDEEEGAQEHPEFAALVASKSTDPLSAATPEHIDRLVAWGRGYEHKPDARLTALLSFLNAVCRPDSKTWSNERVVVFTEYSATLDWVTGVLRQHGFGPDVLATIQGCTPSQDREQIRARFTAPPQDEPLRVLIATDAAGEGIDLQNYCHRLVNLDVPFNPSRLEQRIGRIDRYGQQHAPEIFYFAPVRTSSTYGADQSFLHRIGEKVSTIRTDLGSVNPLIDIEIQEHFKARPATARPAQRDKGADVINAAMAGEQELNRSLTEISHTYAERKQAMHLTPFSARRVVETALSLSNQPPLTEVGDQDSDAEVLDVGRLGPRWQPALRGLDTRLKPGVLRPITFDDQAAAGRDDVVHIHLGHALLQKSARMLRNSLVGSDSRVHRVTAVVDEDIPTSCVASVSRLVLVGRGGLRLHEEVFVSGIRLHGNDMAEEKVHDLLDHVLDARALELAPATVRGALAKQWSADGSRMRRRLEQAMRRRAQRKQADVSGRLDARRDSDIGRAQQIFAAFRVNLTESLAAIRAAHEEQAAMLFSDDQQRQRLRDIRAMQERLLTLADEEQREIAGLRERYADVQPFVSAAAVIFALTPADAAELGRRP